jgi:hypothetical protein
MYKEVILKRIVICLLALAGFAVLSQVKCHAQDMELNFGGFTVPVPFRELKATSLYSINKGRGFLGGETVLIKRGDGSLNIGGATAVQTGIAFPMASLEVKLPPILFLPTSGDVLFGIWGGRDFDVNQNYWGINTSLKFGKVKGS